MAKSVKALINPEVLKWARERSGLTLETAAQKLAQKTETIESWANLLYAT
jgi:ribosome-binding protein aMBF1 (putative translation factor)